MACHLTTAPGPILAGTDTTIPNAGTAGAALDATVTGLQRVAGPAVWIGDADGNGLVDANASIGDGATAMTIEVHLDGDALLDLMATSSTSRRIVSEWNSGNQKYNAILDSQGRLAISFDGQSASAWDEAPPAGTTAIRWVWDGTTVALEALVADVWQSVGNPKSYVAGPLSPVVADFAIGLRPATGAERFINVPINAVRITADAGDQFDLTADDIAAAAPDATTIATTSGHTLTVLRGTSGPVTTVVPSGVEYINPDSADLNNRILTSTVPGAFDIPAGVDAVGIYVGRPGRLDSETYLGIWELGDSDYLVARSRSNSWSARIAGDINGTTAGTPTSGPDAPQVVAVVIDRATNELRHYSYDANGLVGTNSVAIGTQGFTPAPEFIRVGRNMDSVTSAFAWNKGVGVAPTDAKLESIALGLLSNSPAVLAEMSETFQGLWLAGGLPTYDIWLHIEMFYNPDDIRRFGNLAFGDDVFGDSGGSGAPYWVDVTHFIGDCSIQRGQTRPNAFTPSDVVTFTAVDPAGEFVNWSPPASLASPTIGTPCRIGFSTGSPNVPGVPGWVVTALVDQMNELAAVPERTVEFGLLGTKSMLATPLFFPNRPRETAQARIEAVIAQIGYPYPIVYDPILATIDLETDDGGTTRTGIDAYASTVIEEAANSCGLQTYTDNDGSLLFASVGFRPTTDPLFVVSNCDQPYADAVAVSIDYRADAFEVLNVVQVINRLDPNRSAEASDAPSIGIYGRRADGYGFPLTTVNQTGTEAQLIADGILAETKDIVNRCENIVINTLTDPRWWGLFPLFSMYDAFLVVRDHPVTDAFYAQLIGYQMLIGPSGVEMTLNLNTVYEPNPQL